MLLLGLGTLLVGTGLLGTLLGLRAKLEGFSNTAIGTVMTAYYLGYVIGTFVVPVLIRRVGHIRAFAAMAAVGSAAVLGHGLVVHPVVWFALRAVIGVAVVGVYMVVESWLNSDGPGNVASGRGTDGHGVTVSRAPMNRARSPLPMSPREKASRMGSPLPGSLWYS